jgi:hypothetical protein
LLVTTIDGGRATPAVNYTQYGVPLVDRPSGQTVWLDYRTQYSYAPLVTTSTPGERYVGVGTLSGNATGPGSKTATYYHQRLLSANYSMFGGSGLTPPTFAGISEGSEVSMTLSLSSSQIWLDSGSQYNVTRQMLVAPDERWSTGVPSLGTVSSDLNLTFSYYLQFTLTSSYTIVGGQSPSQPILNFTSHGSAEQIESLESPVTVWADAGSSFAVNGLLKGSSSTERWVSVGSTAGSIDSPTNVVLTYYHQYLLQLEYSLRGTGSPSAPVLMYVSLGAGSNLTLTPSYQLLWADGESILVLPQTLQGASQGTRWELGSQVPQVVSESITENVVYYLQVVAQVSLHVVGGGNFSGSDGYFVSFGRAASIPLQNSATYWLDSGSTWGIQSVVSGQQGERWILVGGASNGNATAPFSLALEYQHQYEVVDSLGSHGGGRLTTSPVNSTQWWYSVGQSVRLNATSNPGWEFGSWVGNQNITAPSDTLTISGFVNETAVFYPGVTIGAGSGGTVKVVGDISSGTASPSKPFIAYETPGSTLAVYATPSNSISQFNSWTGTGTGSQNPLTFTVTGPGRVSATFSTSTLNLSILVGGVALVAIGALLAFRTLRKGGGGFLGIIRGRLGLGGK